MKKFEIVKTIKGFFREKIYVNINIRLKIKKTSLSITKNCKKSESKIIK
ncbi:MAG: hypothetical protein QXD62_02405 [Candidatus Woesearchaeota archaeon]